MRMLLALPLLIVAGCNVQSDDANDSVTIGLNEQRLDNAIDDVGNAAEEAGDALGNEVRDLDIDVDGDGNEAGNSN
jgi:hypothetical protein